jgi:hypothetical protein
MYQVELVIFYDLYLTNKFSTPIFFMQNLFLKKTALSVLESIDNFTARPGKQKLSRVLILNSAFYLVLVLGVQVLKI